MKYELIEATVDAFKITQVNYTLDDGSIKQDTPDAAVLGDYWVVNANSEGKVAKAEFEAKYRPLA